MDRENIADEGYPDSSAETMNVSAEEIERLKSENKRLREVGPEEDGPEYRRAALLFLGTSALAGGASTVFPEARDVLIGLAGIGVFAAILLVTVTSERFVSARLADSIYETLSRNQEDIAAALGLEGDPVYIPTTSGVVLTVTDSYRTVLTITEESESVSRSDGEIQSLLLQPIGLSLLRTLERTGKQLPNEVEDLVAMLTEAVEEQFELVDNVKMTGSGNEWLTIQLSGSVIGDANGLDHPVVSLFAVCLATVNDGPVSVETTTASTEDPLITFQWGSELSTVVDS